MGDAAWTVVVPVKPLPAAKSRLRGALGAARHEDLVLALALDTVTAVSACPEVAEVVVVTDDPVLGAAVTALGARVVADVPAAGLNPAFAYGARLADPGRRVAALAADLPALRAGELCAALRAAAGPARHFVADAPGTGTVLLTAPPGVPLDPRFGGRSAAAHAGSGAVALTGDWPGLRRDVDTPADLREAVGLGVGAHTSAVLRDGGRRDRGV